MALPYALAAAGIAAIAVLAAMHPKHPLWTVLLVTASGLVILGLLLYELHIRRTTAMQTVMVTIASLINGADQSGKDLAEIARQLRKNFHLSRSGLIWTDQGAPPGGPRKGRSYQFPVRVKGATPALLSVTPKLWLSRSRARMLQSVADHLGLVIEARGLAASRRHAASHDALTGCLNEMAFRESLERRLFEPGWVMVGLIDLDDFKQINDTLGHDMGDEVLRVIGARLQEALPTECTARLHGDEFAWWKPTAGATGRELGEWLNNLQKHLSRPRQDAGLPMAGCSLGATIVPSGTKVDEALRMADAAMYDGKRAGKGRACLTANMAGLTSSPPDVA